MNTNDPHDHTNKKTQRKNESREKNKKFWEALTSVFQGLHKTSWLQNGACLLIAFIPSLIGIFMGSAQGTIYGIAVTLTLFIWAVAYLVANEIKPKAPDKIPPNALLNEDGQVLTTESNPAPAKPERKSATIPDNTNAPTSTPPKTEPVKGVPANGASSSLLPSQIIAMHSVDPFSLTSTGSGGIKSTMQYANEGDIVGWTLYLLDATSFWSPFGDSNLKIRCTEQPMDTTAVVVFNVPLFAHEYLRVSIDRYQMFSVVGTIAHIGPSEILLKDAIMEPITDGL